MSSDFNPYEAPKADEKKPKKSKKAKSQTLSEFDEQAQDRIVFWAKALRPWITFFGVLSYILAVLLVLFGFYTVVITSSLPSYTGRASSTGPAFFIVYLVFAVLYIIIGGRLFRFRDSLDNIREGESVLDPVADAFERLTAFWSFVGKMTITLLVLYGLFIGGAFLYAYSLSR